MTSNEASDKLGLKSYETTVVHDFLNSWTVYYHGNAIAWFYPATGRLELSNAGWETKTTKDRLNTLLSAFGIPVYIRQKNWTWYFHANGKDYPFYNGEKFNIRRNPLEA